MKTLFNLKELRKTVIKSTLFEDKKYSFILLFFNYKNKTKLFNIKS